MKKIITFAVIACMITGCATVEPDEPYQKNSHNSRPACIKGDVIILAGIIVGAIYKILGIREQYWIKATLNKSVTAQEIISEINKNKEIRTRNETEIDFNFKNWFTTLEKCSLKIRKEPENKFIFRIKPKDKDWGQSRKFLTVEEGEPIIFHEFCIFPITMPKFFKRPEIESSSELIKRLIKITPQTAKYITKEAATIIKLKEEIAQLKSKAKKK